MAGFERERADERRDEWRAERWAAGDRSLSDVSDWNGTASGPERLRRVSSSRRRRNDSPIHAD